MWQGESGSTYGIHSSPKFGLILRPGSNHNHSGVRFFRSVDGSWEALLLVDSGPEFASFGVVDLNIGPFEDLLKSIERCRSPV